MLEKYPIPNYIGYAIPVFFILISVELLIARRTQKDYYRFNDSINDLTLGIYSRVFGKFYAIIYLFAYIYIYENFRLTTLGIGSVFAWVFGFFAVDFIYYWFHRLSHQVAIIWGSHDPHHSSEEYNLSVALRQGSFQGIFSGPFYLPLALIGLHPIVFFTHSQFNTLYQFWIHTRSIKSLGFLEKFLNTPSHHRVHHGKNPEYIDKNHAGTLIIWDKLFGTFQPEKEEPVYGIVKPLSSFNPMWANFHYWAHLARMVKKARGFDKIRVLFKDPGYKPDYMGGTSEIPPVTRDSQVKYDPPVSRAVNGYVLLQFILVMPLAVKLIFMGSEAFTLYGVALAVVILVNLMAIGWLLENRTFGWMFELLRISAVAAVAGSFWYINPTDIASGIYALVMLSTLLPAAALMRRSIKQRKLTVIGA